MIKREADILKAGWTEIKTGDLVYPTMTPVKAGKVIAIKPGPPYPKGSPGDNGPMKDDIQRSRDERG